MIYVFVSYRERKCGADYLTTFPDEAIARSFVAAIERDGDSMVSGNPEVHGEIMQITPSAELEYLKR